MALSLNQSTVGMDRPPATSTSNVGPESVKQAVTPVPPHLPSFCATTKCEADDREARLCHGLRSVLDAISKGVLRPSSGVPSAPVLHEIMAYS
jgi:hypothetical protein